MIYAALVMVMMAFCPSGILGLVERSSRRDVKRIRRAGVAAREDRP